MESLDFYKAVILTVVFCVLAPLAGLWMRHRPNFQKATFLAMCFLMISGFFRAQEWGLTLNSLLYRGTARGFHFYWAEAAAITLIFAKLSGDWKHFRFMPPGLWLYLLYCVVSLASLFNAPTPLYGWFAAVKAFKAIVIFLAAFNFIQKEADLRFALTCLGLVMFWELIVVLKQKYVDHIYQVWGTFEHQNSLCMFAILLGMVFLSAAMGPKNPRSGFFLLAFLASAAVVQSTLSRGGLAIFAVGTVCVVIASLIDRPTKRRIQVLVALALVGGLGLSMTMDTIISRFNDYGNEESARTRDMLNISARMMLEDYPAGIGWNNFAQTINPPYSYGDHIDRWQLINGNPIDPDYKKGVVESLWWLLLSETGYQGFFTFLGFILLFLWWNIRNAIHYRRTFLGAVSIGLLAGTSMNYLQSFLERVLTQPRNMFAWLILLAITARILTWRKREAGWQKLMQKRRQRARMEREFRAIRAPLDDAEPDEDFEEEEHRDIREPAESR